jgi:hypothetical protein
VRLGDVDFTVAVMERKFRNGGAWSLFICPQCNRRASILRLLNNQPACVQCCYAHGVKQRADPFWITKRAERSVAHRCKLLSGGPARLHPRPDRTLDRRRSLEIALERAELVLQTAAARRAVRSVYGRAPNKKGGA